MALKSTKGNGSIYITDYSLMAYFGANNVYIFGGERVKPPSENAYFSFNYGIKVNQVTRLSVHIR